MPIWTKGWRWFEPRVRSATQGMKLALVVLGLLAALCYALFGPLVFDAGYWILGKVARTQADRRLRVGLALGLVAVYLVVLGVSGSTAPKATADASSVPAVGASATTPTASASASVAVVPTVSAPAIATAGVPTPATKPPATKPPATPAVTEPPVTPPVTAPPATPVVTAPPSLTVAIAALTPSVAPSGDVTLTATTSPGATCTPTITYHSGEVSKAKGLDPQVATSGTVSWTWTVGPRTGAGTATAAVECTLDGQSKGTSQTFEVT